MAETRENRVSDFLNSFSSNHESDSISVDMDEAEPEEVELTLGLSLNGRFGIDSNPKNTTKLTRTSSIPEYMNPSAQMDQSSSSSMTQMFPVVGNLIRTCSLPVEPEEEIRKRKEMQSLRRMEAKRKRIEKQKKLGLRECGERKRVVPLPAKFENMFLTKSLCSEKLRNYLQREAVVVSSQGNASESESHVIEFEGMGGSAAEVRSMEANARTLSDQMESSGPNHDSAITRTTSFDTKMKNQFNKLTVSDTNDTNNIKTKESFVRNAQMHDMPCVSTQGDDPNATRINGVLYRYDQSEEIRILCICHGKLLTPLEFVKHAGRTDVAQPLKHIVVTPSSAFM